jgi:beta-glucosidase
VGQGVYRPFQNDRLKVEDRIKDLLNQMTTDEKISLLGFDTKGVERLGIPSYNWWNEALHGVARAGKATIFPQAIGMAASFNEDLMLQCATAISTEARAKHNLAVKNNHRLQYMGLTFWSPNINIFRDPRWGRGQETYGEDPFLTAQMGISFVKGLQGNDKQYLKASACAKHFAVHSGPEKSRHGFDAQIDEKDLRETYLYAFKKLVDHGVESVMCAYNRVNNQPCCTGNPLLRDILRKEWKFGGHVVTDCWALQDIYTQHKSLATSVEVAVAAIKAGINVDCSHLLQDDVKNALKQNMLTETDIDMALMPSLKTQFKLGFFDKNSNHPFRKYGLDSICNDFHKGLAREMAAQSMILLKNSPVAGKSEPVLPIKKDAYSSFMVIGPNATSTDALIGNYHGVSHKTVNFLEGITHALDPHVRIEYDMGCDFTDTTRFGGIWAASNAELTIAVIGFTPVYEGEEGDAFLADGHGDRINMKLPASHISFMRALRKGVKSPIVAVVTGGSAVDISDIEAYADAIIFAWYPGEQGGTALADILFGKVSPSGRLPVTFYKSFSDLPDYNSYAMRGRTYRYFNKDVQYPFGYGLSYSTFQYEWVKKPPTAPSNNEALTFSVKIKNTGKFDADDVVQAYIEYPALDRMPVKELKAFRKIKIQRGKDAVVALNIPLSELQKWDLKERQWKLYDGNYKLIIAAHAQDVLLEHAFKVSSVK